MGVRLRAGLTWNLTRSRRRGSWRSLPDSQGYPGPPPSSCGSQAGLAKSPLSSWTLLLQGSHSPSDTHGKGGWGDLAEECLFLRMSLCPPQAQSTCLPSALVLCLWKPHSAPSTVAPGPHQVLCPSQAQQPPSPPVGLPRYLRGTAGGRQRVGVDPWARWKAALRAGWGREGSDLARGPLPLTPGPSKH